MNVVELAAKAKAILDMDPERGAIQAEAASGVRENPLMGRLRELVSFVPLDKFLNPPTAQDCLVPALGIVHGPPNTFIGKSFVGKTLISMSGALDVALGDPFWGVYECKRAKVLHLDHEQGLHATAQRFSRMCRARGVNVADVVGKWWETTVFPALNLKTKQALDLYCLLFDGFGLVLADALKGLTPGVKENDSEMADYIGILRMASERTGAAVWMLHHDGKDAADGSKKARSEMGRGSSAIKDQSQTWLVATGEKYKPVHVSHEKTRAATRTADDFMLHIEDVDIGGDPMGGIRVVHREMCEDGQERVDPGVIKAEGKIVAFFRKHAGQVRASRKDVGELVGVRREYFEKAFSKLLFEGVIVREGSKMEPTFVLKEPA